MTQRSGSGRMVATAGNDDDCSGHSGAQMLSGGIAYATCSRVNVRASRLYSVVGTSVISTLRAGSQSTSVTV